MCALESRTLTMSPCYVKPSMAPQGARTYSRVCSVTSEALNDEARAGLTFHYSPVTLRSHVLISKAERDTVESAGRGDHGHMPRPRN